MTVRDNQASRGMANPLAAGTNRHELDAATGRRNPFRSPPPVSPRLTRHTLTAIGRFSACPAFSSVRRRSIKVFSSSGPTIQCRLMGVGLRRLASFRSSVSRAATDLGSSAAAAAEPASWSARRRFMRAIPPPCDPVAALSSKTRLARQSRCMAATGQISLVISLRTIAGKGFECVRAVEVGSSCCRKYNGSGRATRQWRMHRSLEPGAGLRPLFGAPAPLNRPGRRRQPRPHRPRPLRRAQ